MIPQALEEYLNNSQVPYEVRHHPPTMTAEQLAQRENVDGHQVAKVVVMRENGKYFMMVLPASYFVDLREARRLTGHPLMLICLAANQQTTKCVSLRRDTR